MTFAQKIIYVAMVLSLYVFIGSYKQVQEYYQLQMLKPSINAVKQMLQTNPDKVIESLKQYPESTEAQSVLFKIYVGMHSYQKAYLLYKQLLDQKKISNEIATIFVTIIPFINVGEQNKLDMLSSLKEKVDFRLIQFYQAIILIKQKNYPKAEKLLQLTLSQIQASDPMYKIVETELRNLQIQGSYKIGS